MSYTPVQTKTAVSTAAGTSITCTFDNPPTDGGLLHAVVWHNGTTLLPLGSSGTTWNVGALNAQQSVCTVYEWYQVGDPAYQTFTATHTGAVSWAVVIREYTDITYPIDLDVGGAYNDAAGASSYQCGTLTTVGSDDLFAAIVGQQGTARTVVSWSNGFTAVADLHPSGGTVGGLAVAEKVLTAPGAYDTFVTLSGTTTSTVSSMASAIMAPTTPSRLGQQQQTAQQTSW